MDAKITVTTRCNARCATCPVWKLKPLDMKPEDFAYILHCIDDNPVIHRTLINNIGDIYNHPQREALFDILEHFRFHRIITTNGALIDRVPKVEEFVISFNGWDKASYEASHGIPFEATLERILHYINPLLQSVGFVQIHTLIWEGNAKGARPHVLEKRIADFWGSLGLPLGVPGRLGVRISYKYDNQFKEDKTLRKYKEKKRIPCSYLDTLSIHPNGDVIQCAHDFAAENVWGNILVDDIPRLLGHKKRIEKQMEHRRGAFRGLCESCNFNISDKGKIKWMT